MTFYLNGEKQGARRLDVPRRPGKGALVLGRGTPSHMPIAPAVFDQLLIWDRVLPPREVAEHAESARNVRDRSGLTFMELFSTKNRLQEKLPDWENAAVRIQLKNDKHKWNEQKQYTDAWKSGETRKLTLVCDLRETPMPVEDLNVRLETADRQLLNAKFDTKTNGYRVEIEKMKRPWKTGYTDIREYDDITISVDNPTNSPLKVPLLVDLRHVANITGLCPILVDSQGRPTGIPVQLSKNWHYQPIGAYLRAYMLVPAEPGTNLYTLRIPYGFYGTVPSASHAQLSLVGYGGNGRWEQLAIGCWGETICFDMDMSCVDVAITDVRLLMARNGTEGRKWTWTDAGWGGDWLHAQGSKKQKLYPTELKTAYLSHGPCLTDVQYTGKYGPERSVDLQAVVRTLRTDDYARTFQKFHYRSEGDASLEEGWLFKMGRTSGAVRPRVAYGNRDGLLAEEIPSEFLQPGSLLVDQLTLEGEGPWWVSFPEATNVRDRGWGQGTRGLIIRSYHARFGGVSYKNPTISVPLFRREAGSHPNLDLLLVPPPGVKGFQKGDEVEMDLEWVSVPNVADDYYGPNEAFRDFLMDHPNSWEPIFREVAGNDLKVKVYGGRLLSTYPVIVQAESKEVVIDIEGGVGMVPLRVEGLHQVTGYTLYQVQEGERVALDQSVYGNDFWQTDYDAASNSWKRSYNLPLDGIPRSRWVLTTE